MLNGRQLVQVFQRYAPFEPDGRLRPEDQRRTVLAANANSPLEVWGRAFAQAAAQEGGSPMIIQFSYHALRTVGGDPGMVPVPAGAAWADELPAVVRGGAMARTLVELFAAQYGARWVALGLDHFAVPGFREGMAARHSLALHRARGMIADAREAAGADFPAPDPELAAAFAAYLASEEYRRFREHFLRTVEVMGPAWGMIDTEDLPPLLDFAVTRDIVDGVRSDLGNADMVLEAEFGATGQTGEPVGYRPLKGEELQRFARQVAAFLRYTGAEGVAYPIGMQHAAPRSQRHEPDGERLEVVGRTVLRECGRYVPFVQHGGTGAARLLRGLVAKDNVNTHFLAAAANALADHVDAQEAGIRAGEKASCGPGIYLEAMAAIREAAVGKLREAGTYGEGPQLGQLPPGGTEIPGGEADGGQE